MRCTLVPFPENSPERVKPAKRLVARESVRIVLRGHSGHSSVCCAVCGEMYTPACYEFFVDGTENMVCRDCGRKSDGPLGLARLVVRVDYDIDQGEAKGEDEHDHPSLCLVDMPNAVIRLRVSQREDLMYSVLLEAMADIAIGRPENEKKWAAEVQRLLDLGAPLLSRPDADTASGETES